MASKYPEELDSLSTSNTNSTENEDTHPALHNDANSAINAIEAELGTEPSGGAATVAARLEHLVGTSMYNSESETWEARPECKICEYRSLVKEPKEPTDMESGDELIEPKE